jgi:hypothetical protein
MKATVDQLKKERRSTEGTRIKEALVAFADNMVANATEMRVKEVEFGKGAGDEGDTKPLGWEDCDIETLAVVRMTIQEQALV